MNSENLFLNLTTNRHKQTRTTKKIWIKSSWCLCVSWLIFILFFCLTAASCFPQKLPVREILIEREGQGVAVVKAEIARTQEERSRGLMFRKKLPDGEGMLFVFDRDEVLSFWMKNTQIPLSIAFIAYDGKIIEIKDMQPHDLNSVISSRSARYALETPQGWFSRAGVGIGDIVRVEGVNTSTH